MRGFTTSRSRRHLPPSRCRQSWTFHWAALVIAATALAVTDSPLTAGELHQNRANTTAVPPSLEIAVLDPGVDPEGNPAVLLKPGPNGQMQVDIPPTILVHRYYYTGDRSFQAQILRGGPCIVVANHPHTGVRTYIPAQMLPGAPRVTYTRHAIKYAYPTTVISVCFLANGQGKVSYRNVSQFQRHVQDHAEQWKKHMETHYERSKLAAHGATSMVADNVKTVLLPAVNLAQYMPFGKAMFGDLQEQLMARGAQARRDAEVRRAAAESRLNNLTLPTLR